MLEECWKETKLQEKNQHWFLKVKAMPLSSVGFFF